MWLALMHKIDQGRVMFVPTKSKHSSSHPSYPAHIIRLQSEKRRLWRSRHNLVSKIKYNNASKRYKIAVEKYHVNKERNLLKLNSKNFFKHMNRKLCSQNSIPNLRKDNNNITSNTDKANEFLNIFSSVFTADNGLLGKMPDSINCQPTDIHPDFAPASISKHLKLINSQSSAGPDNYPGIFWHSLHSDIALPLSLIFNKSFSSGCLPSCWKHSVITPIFKKGDPTMAANYRPISLTSIPCKVMESIVREALLDHLTINNFLSPDQHGFLASHSTGSQLLECINDWTDSVEQSKCTDVCYIDFSRAFDSVSLPKLIQKFAAYGVSGNCLNWLKAFLIGRTMCVNINNVLSASVSQSSGVPQGSVLGPICFIVFINDITKCIKHCRIKLYADDVKLYFHFCCDRWIDFLQRDLDAIVEWANMWQLNISISKTFLLHIGSKNPRHVYSINGTDIVAVDTIKDLGVHVSHDLSWSVNVQEVVKKANKIANVILHAFRCHNVDLYMSAFSIYVKPILDYCSYIWNPVLCRDIDVLENVLRAYTRRVFYKCNLQRMSYPERLAVVEMPSLERSRLTSCLTMFFKVYHKFVNCNILNNFTFPTYMSNLRGHSKRLLIPFCRASVRKHYFSFRYLRIWNNLPEHVVSTNVTKAFTNYVKQMDLHTVANIRH